jgi:hypothetical protein
VRIKERLWILLFINKKTSLFIELVLALLGFEAPACRGVSNKGKQAGKSEGKKQGKNKGRTR